MSKKEEGLEVSLETPWLEKQPRLWQFNLFTKEPEAIPVEIEEFPEGEEYVLEEGISCVKNGDSSQVIISGFGIYLAKHSERLIVKSNKKRIYQFPFFRLNEIIIASRGVSLSSDLIEELCSRGIRISFLKRRGRPYAMLTSPMLTATISARREQILAFDDKRGLEFSKKVVQGKIKNQGKLLKYFGKYLKKVDFSRFNKVKGISSILRNIALEVEKIKGKNINEVRGSLIALEGKAGKLYWEGVKEIIGERVEFFGREARGAVDLVNSMLNYGYGILYSVVWGAIINAGLEPFAGFLHTDRPGKPSLVLDLVEEFRQPVVDRVVISHINLGEVAKMSKGLLDPETRKILGSKVLQRLESTEKYEGKNYRIKSIIQIQARNLASFLRGERKYKPFTFRW